MLQLAARNRKKKSDFATELGNDSWGDLGSVLGNREEMGAGERVGSRDPIPPDSLQISM